MKDHKKIKKLNTPNENNAKATFREGVKKNQRRT